MRFPWIARFGGQCAVVVWAWGGFAPSGAQAQSPNLKMGNPSAAQADPGVKNNYLLDRTYFASSYDNARGTPNWVSWRLSKEDLGHAPRDNFYADPDLPAGFLRVEPAAYNGSGFDRGHMCPHGDRTATDAASLATFAMTNIIPQSHNLNTMAWESLENYCRSLAQTEGKVCYIVAGPSGQGGTGKNGSKQTTPDGKVVVPGQNWKVAMVLDQDVASAGDLTAQTPIRLIAAIMPNDDSAVGNDWTPFQATVNQVEALTGYTFFGAADPAVIGPLKGQIGGFDPAVLARSAPPERGRVDPFTERVSAPPAPARFVPAPPVPARVRPVPIENPAMTDSPALNVLKKAAQGLTYPSETDEPFEVFSWGEVAGPLTDAKLWHLARQRPEARLERVGPDQFFERLTKPRHTASQVNPATAQRFVALLQAIRTELTDVEVIKFGHSEVAIYIIGRTKDGKLVGLRTAATET